MSSDRSAARAHPSPHRESAPRAGIRWRSRTCGQACGIDLVLYGPPGGDDTGIHARPVQSAKDARVLDFDATVHHHFQTGIGGDPYCFVVAYAELHPQHLRADAYRLARDEHQLAGLAKAIDHIDAMRYRREIRVTLLTQDCLIVRIDRNDPIAMVLHVFCGKVAGSIPLRG